MFIFFQLGSYCTKKLSIFLLYLIIYLKFCVESTSYAALFADTALKLIDLVFLENTNKFVCYVLVNGNKFHWSKLSDCVAWSCGALLSAPPWLVVLITWWC